ncbi:hypothetical protein AYI68_g6838, partial [Smittium mucronatum]
MPKFSSHIVGSGFLIPVRL